MCASSQLAPNTSFFCAGRGQTLGTGQANRRSKKKSRAKTFCPSGAKEFAVILNTLGSIFLFLISTGAVGEKLAHFFLGGGVL